MRSPKLFSVASSAVLLGALCSQAFAWSISGTVLDKDAGTPIEGANISAFNYPGVSSTTITGGVFSISNDGTEGLLSTPNATMHASVSNGIFTLTNANAHLLKISIIDAMGKVTYQRSFYEISNVSIDLAKVSGQGAKFIRIVRDGSSQTYMMKGKNALLKEGEALPTLMFSKDGYKQEIYQAKAAVETAVTISMEKGSSVVSSSSKGSKPTLSSSSTSEPPRSSSSAVEEVVDCSAKTMKTSTTIYVDGRSVDVVFPNGYTGDKPVPLLVSYHPIGGNSDGAKGLATAQAALSEGAIVAAPNGGLTPQGGMMGGVQAWNVGPCCTDEDDVTFSRHFIAELQKNACIDPKRIYASGFSMGGGMSNYAGCFMADVFAAAAPHAFDLAKEIVDEGKCKPARSFPILNFRGTNDFVVSYDGGLSSIVNGKPITFMGAVNNMKEWAKMNGCQGEPKQNTPASGCQMYENCNDGVKVGLCTIQGGSHAEGDGKQAWDFLKQFTLP